MERSVNDLDIRRLLIKRLLFNLGKKSVENITSDRLIKSLCRRFFKSHMRHSLEIRYCIDISDNLVCGVGAKLTACFVIDLVSVILLGIVAGGNNRTCRTAEISDRKRKHRSRHKGVIKVNLDAVGTENLRRINGKISRIVS